jgi:excisionase family DNA binding protein
MAGDGTIPALRIGETWRFDRREIERWLRGEGPARTEETD